jgi:hypothetical protein
MFNSCPSLQEIPPCNLFGSTGASKTTAFSGFLTSCVALKRIGATGICHSITLPNTGMIGSTQLNEIYTNLPVVGASGAGAKTITVSGNWGTALDTPMIAISKGWTVSG